MENKTRKCTKCGKIYPETKEYFYKEKRCREGLNAMCKKCIGAYVKQYALTHIDKRRQYREDNKEKIAACCKKYYRAHMEERREYNKEYIQRPDVKVRLQLYSASPERKEHLRKDAKTPHRKECNKKYRMEHKDEIKAWNKEYQKKHGDKIKEYNKTPARKESRKQYEKTSKRIAYRKQYEKTFKRKQYFKNLRETNVEYKILQNLRRRLSTVIRSQGAIKSAHTIELVGCSMKKLIKHIESQFDSKMSWDNYGKLGWHIDHIKPCASFDLTIPLEQRKCFNWKNLQPLWWPDNFKKNSFYNGKYIRKRRIKNAKYNDQTV